MVPGRATVVARLRKAWWVRDRLWLLIALAVLLSVGRGLAYSATGNRRAAARPAPSSAASPSPRLFSSPPPEAGGDPGASDDAPSEAQLAACVTRGVTLEELGSAPVEADDAAGQVTVITDRVEAPRGLPEREPVAAGFLTGEEIEERASELIGQDYTAADADLDRRLLAALGAVPADIDLLAAQSELVSGQIAGYYDTDASELVVRADDPSQTLPPGEQVTLAHELTHALADQAFGLDLPEDRPADEQAASVALVEGDAVLAMERFSLEAFDLAEQQQMAADPEIAEAGEQLEDFPHVLTASLLFSYAEGLGFVCDRYAEGGWAAVDAAYEDRPTTTAEIMFPGRYPTAAIAPRPVPQAGGAWEVAREDTLGAADLLWLFEAPGDDLASALDEPRDRAADWAGGTYALSTDGDASALGVALVAVEGRGADLCASASTWYDAAFSDAAPASAQAAELARDGAEQDAVLTCEADEVRLGIAPDLATAATLAG